MDSINSVNKSKRAGFKIKPYSQETFPHNILATFTERIKNNVIYSSIN